MGRVRDKVAIVTGSANGVGAGDARLLAAEDARVAVTDIDEDNGRAIAGMGTFCAYSAARGAAAGLTRKITAHCRGHKDNIRCNAIYPDGIRTPMVAGLYEQPQPGMLPDVTDPNGAMTRMAEPRDIASMVLYPASDESRFVNDAAIRINNGWTIWADR